LPFCFSAMTIQFGFRHPQSCCLRLELSVEFEQMFARFSDLIIGQRADM